MEESARDQVREWECRMCCVYKRFGQEVHTDTFLSGKKCKKCMVSLGFGAKLVAFLREVWSVEATIQIPHKVCVE